MRLWLISPDESHFLVRRDPNEVDSLSVYVLELDEPGITGTARQQGRGGFWGDMLAGDRVRAEVNGFLTKHGHNSTGAHWFATHQLQVSSENLRLGAGNAAVLFGFLSVENDLTRDEDTFAQLSVMPGVGFGFSWPTGSQGSITVRSGINAGPWFSLQNGGASPGFSFNLHRLTVQL